MLSTLGIPFLNLIDNLLTPLFFSFFLELLILFSNLLRYLSFLQIFLLGFFQPHLFLEFVLLLFFEDFPELFVCQFFLDF